MSSFFSKPYVQISIFNKTFLLSKPFQNLKNKFLFFRFFFVFFLFYSSLLFSNPYTDEGAISKPSWSCEIDNECLRLLKSDLDKESHYSIYQVCEEEYNKVWKSKLFSKALSAGIIEKVGKDSYFTFSRPIP